MAKYRTIKLGTVEFKVLKRYNNLALIGQGTYGLVCSADDSVLNRRVAIKKLMRPFQSLEHARRAYREFLLMKLVNHKNIIGLLDAFSPQKTEEEFTDVYLVMELMSSDLRQVIEMKIDHHQISFLMYQMLCGIKHLHAGNIIHRDLKPGNIVVNGDCTLKILDFGLARKVDSTSMTAYVVTRPYRAPEVILEMEYEKKVDIWSAGCVMAELITGNILFPGKDSIDQWNKIVQMLGTPSSAFIIKLPSSVRSYVLSQDSCPAHPFESLFPDYLFPADPALGTCKNNEARDILSKMLVIDPADRFDVDEALRHAYFKHWYEDGEVNGPPPSQKAIDALAALDEKDRTLEDWRRLMFNEEELVANRR